MVSIELTDSEAESFREFMRVRETFDILTHSGVFNSKACEARLNFNDDGVLTKIRFVTTGWDRKRD